MEPLPFLPRVGERVVHSPWSHRPSLRCVVPVRPPMQGWE